MLKTIKRVSFIIAISVFFTTVSCLTDEEEIQIVRSPELEASELYTALSNLEAGGYDIDTTDLGIFYVIHEEGEGPYPVAGDTCYIEYEGYLLDGIIFDASSDHYLDGIWELIYKDIPLIEGFDDGIALMNKGTEIDIIIPSYLAYGAYGAGIIPPYSTIVFSAIMHDLKPQSD
ncbi:MAG: hypothetical protein HN778_08985 [Prolixibacteraceae bacterium]|nr:hypothetical protein [Prolixibacteraceae bacterium]MBT6004669.1 hypothetical protein [Prolixibacteraceae bacterium]MBT6767237.1 hypothetical protein [Prolixibacteraceae bacterium]MBT6998793.1 hypothetical protein [Prolixibacteraceae bacterium]MBT7394951.1 hypothetical protein [Prolixibacteraceae bacterium]